MARVMTRAPFCTCRAQGHQRGPTKWVLHQSYPATWLGKRRVSRSSCEGRAHIPSKTALRLQKIILFVRVRRVEMEGKEKMRNFFVLFCQRTARGAPLGFVSGVKRGNSGPDNLPLT
ncbi:hypothetical protein SUGI_1172790 [Cryptomeria japonica]|nr:hypothetical protein SUGI_1172790 [Cryptomeria japonica]